MYALDLDGLRFTVSLPLEKATNKMIIYTQSEMQKLKKTSTQGEKKNWKCELH